MPSSITGRLKRARTAAKEPNNSAMRISSKAWLAKRRMGRETSGTRPMHNARPQQDREKGAVFRGTVCPFAAQGIADRKIDQDQPDDSRPDQVAGTEVVPQ